MRQLGASEVRSTQVLAPSLLTALLLELPIGGLWLYPLSLTAWRLGLRPALTGVVQVWLIRLLLTLLVYPAGAAEAILNEVILLTLATCIGGLFTALVLRGVNDTRATGITALTVGALTLGWVGYHVYPDPTASLAALRNDVIAPLIKSLEELGSATETDLDTQARLDALADWLSAHGEWVLYLLPAVVTTAMTMTLWLNLWLLKVADPTFGGGQALRDWRAPDLLIWTAIAAVLLCLLGQTLPMALGVNLLLVVGVGFTLAGLSLAAFAAHRWRFPGWTLVLGLLLLFLSGGLPFMALVGLLDYQLDFRSRWPRSDDGYDISNGL